MILSHNKHTLKCVREIYDSKKTNLQNGVLWLDRGEWVRIPKRISLIKGYDWPKEELFKEDDRELIGFLIPKP